MNYLGEGVGPERQGPEPLDSGQPDDSPWAELECGAPAAGSFLHRIRRSQTRAEFFRICRDFLDHDEPMPLEPAGRRA